MRLASLRCEAACQNVKYRFFVIFRLVKADVHFADGAVVDAVEVGGDFVAVDGRVSRGDGPSFYVLMCFLFGVLPNLLASISCAAQDFRVLSLLLRFVLFDCYDFPNNHAICYLAAFSNMALSIASYRIFGVRNGIKLTKVRGESCRSYSQGGDLAGRSRGGRSIWVAVH